MFTALSRKSHVNICTTFSPTDNSWVKVQRGKTVAASITGKPLYPPVILHIIRMSLVCHSYLIVCHFCVTRISFVCHSYVNRMYSMLSFMSSYVIRISLVCHSYTIWMYSYVIRIPLICTCMPIICHSYVIRMSLVCQSYVLVCHSYVTRMYFYHEPFERLFLSHLSV